MEVLTAGLTPLLLHKRAAEPKRLLPLKLPKLSCTPEVHFLPRSLTAGSLTILSSLLAVDGPAGALSYEEVLQLSPGGLTDIDISGILNDIINFASENAIVIGGGAIALAVLVVLAQVLKSSKPWGVESAKSAYAKLSEFADAQLLDIREGRDIKEVGRPDIRSLKKKAVAITFTRDDKLGFLKKLALKFKDPRNTTLFILDKFDGNSELVAELVTANGFKAAYGIKDGAEGARGWMNSGLPWSGPRKTLDIDFSDLTDAISSAFGGEGSNGLPVALGLAAATGLGLFTFTEIETVLQIVGSAALLQLVTKKLLYAEDRKATLQQVDEFVNTKVAPKELVDELKMIGKALLPAPINKRASLPAPTVSVEKVDAAAENKSEIKVEAATDPPPEINSVPKAEFSQESVPVAPRPLSPYPSYPDFKPPSSPSPSQP